MNDPALPLHSRILKRTFDIFASVLGLIALSPVILAGFCIALVDARANGFFVQRRIGQWGKPFPLFKLRTMRVRPHSDSPVTIANDPRITRSGILLRKLRIDELPQLANVLLGHMSFVGPRPDVPGFADRLQGKDRTILAIRPGITGPATLRFRNEAALLEVQKEPEDYNRQVLFPAKVEINLQYIEEYSFVKDLYYIWCTVIGKAQ